MRAIQPGRSRMKRLCVALLLGCLLAGHAPGAGEIGVNLSEAVLSKAEAKYGADARKRLVDWQQLLTSNRKQPELEKLKLVNDFFNENVIFVSDQDHWGVNDYWATPVETLASHGGDCEDFAIGKYFSLLALGVSVDKLRITYVKAINWNPINQAHMVLTYYPTPDAIPLVLDNLIPEIRPASNRPDLIPVYSFNGEGLWLAKERGSGKAVGKPTSLGLWRDLTSRFGLEFSS